MEHAAELVAAELTAMPLAPVAPPLGASAGTYRPGAVICRKYRLEDLLGEGGMGSVWRATNLQLDCPVALKLIRAGLDRTEMRLRLQLEARLAAKLAHPGIVRVFDIGESEEGDPFIVMELLSGKTLTQLSCDEALSATQVVQILLPIVEALAVAHANGVVHRDLKPDNIFVVDETGRAQPKLLDFGIAKSTDGSARGLTQSGALLGTPEYMAPEAARGAATLDGRADIWSLCVVLYERVAGELPFDGDNLHAVLCSIIEGCPKPLPAHVPGSAGLWKVLQRGLAKEPFDRFQSMAELGRELAAWLKSQRVHTDASGLSLEAKWRLSAPPGAASPRASREKPRGRPSSLWLIMTALFALALGGAWSSASGKTRLPSASASKAPTAAVVVTAGLMPPATPPPVAIEPHAAAPAAPTPVVHRSPARPAQRSAARAVVEAAPAEHVSATRVASSDLIAPY